MMEEFIIPPGSKAIIVSTICETLPGHATEEQTQTSLMEMKELLKTLGIECVGEFIQKKKQLVAGTVIGMGKLKEISETAARLGATMVVCDFEISASQLRNIKDIMNMDVIDRCYVILEIFARHARTSEAKIQINVVRLQYLLPRLSNLWTHLNRQRGGIGVRGGEGEQQIELDRRIVRHKIELYKHQLEEISISREERRKKRKDQVLVGALVGYTNAGKSSIMNRLCNVDVLEENKLFATLDSTYRTLNPDSRPPMVLIDTVGFLQNLPTILVSGFKTTLESALEADLLIIIVDISDKNWQNHIEVTHETLKELGAEEKERIYVFNKKDLCSSFLTPKIALKKYSDGHLVSSFDAEDMKSLREQIIRYFLAKQSSCDLFIPYSDGQAHAQIRGKANIETIVHHEQGIFYRIKIPNHLFHTLNVTQYVLGPEVPRPSEFII